MKKRFLSLLLSATLLAGLVPGAFAASDIDGHWANKFISYLNDEGIYKASATTGKYEPDREMTRAEFMRYVNRAFHFTQTAPISYTDVKTNAWYYETVQIAEKYGYINGVGNNKMDPDGKVTREQAATIIGRLYKADPGNVSPASLSFTDKEQVSKWSAGYIKAAADKGFLAGYSDGSFKPQKVVTRAEVAKILYFYLGTSLSTAGKAYTGGDLKSDTANVTISENCTLSDATITGDLYISEGLASDAVTLTNVTVEGSIIVSGGTVTMMNTTSDHILVSSPMGRLLQVTATGASHIKTTEIQSAATLYERGLTTAGYEGFSDVIVDGDASVSLTLDAAVANMQIDSKAAVSMTANASVYHLTFNEAATLTGYGTVYQADVKKSGISIAKDITVAGYTLAKGVSAVINGGTVTTSSSAGVSPTKIEVDLNDLTKLGTGVDISLPTGVTASSVTGDGIILSPSVGYTKTSSGLRVLTSYLATLSKGNHTLVITMSDGKKASVAVSVANSSASADAIDLSFDRYYKSSGFKDLNVRVSGVSAESDIRRVVLGLSNLDFGFNSSTRNLVLRRGVLAQLREGSYTVTVDLADGNSQMLSLTVTDSTPADVTTLVGEYDTYNPVEPGFTVDELSRLSVRSVTTVKSGSVQTLAANTDYTVGTRTLTLKKAALEKYRAAKGIVEFTVTLSDNSTITLLVDYIS
ncbi:S-layer homology domain-containing protein [Agathobaculum sp.]|uniref:S-layer homology domain-containing protein n=1 Tax=Agathobaculum sp. TaxID=2048138 RepID=UPI002A83CA30|nr:S-layer homology domain-containing protein [Agathobaculum sp.]MDY3617862.1 S-layer homology domain-containing protein [Agathobaculum sp.]